MNIDCVMYTVTNKITGNNYVIFNHVNNGVSHKATESLVAYIVKNKKNTECIMKCSPSNPNFITKFKNKILYKVEIFYGNYEQWFS